MSTMEVNLGWPVRSDTTPGTEIKKVVNFQWTNLTLPSSLVMIEMSLE